MADDEGAAYWEAVYGQPMHVHAPPGATGSAAAAAAGELERMDDEEYAAYVRQKMWEKTHEGLLEERARREEARRRREDERREARRLVRDVEESLRRGKERRRRRAWRDRWDAYVAAWARWEDEGGASGERPEPRRHFLLEHDAHPAWPVESGRRADVRGSDPDNKNNDDKKKNNNNNNTNEGGSATGTADAVREFFLRGLDAAREGDGDGDGGDGPSASAPTSDHPDASVLPLLKEERVRWHPDKVQQRLGGRVDEALMRDVTAVFQVVDALWSDARARAKEKNS